MALGNETFKRGQVEWALWRAFAVLRSSNPPKVFLTRVKRLLEADRDDKQYLPKASRQGSRFAFSSSESQGQGVDAAFTAFDAFCLALALDLTDMGFKPSEVIGLFRHLRVELERQFKMILRNRLLLEREQTRYDYAYEILKAHTGGRLNDRRVFWVIDKVELKDIYGNAHGRRQGTPLVILTPVFGVGIEGLFVSFEQINRRQSGLRRALVLEIGSLAVRLVALLTQAPVTKRGRK